MKTYKLILIHFIILSLIISCSKDTKEIIDTTIDYSYHAHIHSPNTDKKVLGDTLDLEVDFESHSGQPIHHINVKLIDKINNDILYEKPTNAHVNATSGSYTFTDKLVLSSANGFSTGMDVIMQAKVWGENDGEGEELETVEFHVN